MVVENSNEDVTFRKVQAVGRNWRSFEGLYTKGNQPFEISTVVYLFRLE
jgi:hypothetical protein